MVTHADHTNLAGFIEVDRIEVGWYSLEQARIFTECGDDRIRRAVRADLLKCFIKRQVKKSNVYRKGWHFDRDELVRWMAAGKPAEIVKPNGHTLLLAAPAAPTTLETILEQLVALRADIAECRAGMKRLEDAWLGPGPQRS